MTDISRPGRRLTRDDVTHARLGSTRTCACRPPAGSVSLQDLLLYPGPHSYPTLRSDPPAADG